MHQPFPNDRVLGGIVVASVVYREDNTGEPIEWAIILLMPEAPFYRVGTITPYGSASYRWQDGPRYYKNIGPASGGYFHLGGDY